MPTSHQTSDKERRLDMPLNKPAEYTQRSVLEWLQLADTGVVALPTFQRSYVWKPDRVAEYLCALFENRPTGIFLTLETLGNLPFDARRLNQVDADPSNARELLLDGQQRLTSLWSVLLGRGAARFYVRVEDLSKRDMTVTLVEHYSKTSRIGKKISDPSAAFKENLIPMDVLFDEEREATQVSDRDPDDPGKIWEWCEQASGNEKDARKLENAIKNRLREPLLRSRYLHYCSLPPTTDPSVAINIFVETNKSSATIKTFDIVVALAQERHGENLRDRIKKLRIKHPVLQYYFEGDEQKWIPDIGDWVLKIACLRSKNEHPSVDGMPPKETHYWAALDLLLGGDSESNQRSAIDELEDDLISTLTTVSQYGCSTHAMIPGWPSMHVLAALQQDLRAVVKPAWKGAANKLIAVYLWRSFLTDRYERQANDRLYRDFLGLRKCLNQVRDRGEYAVDCLPPVFDDKEHPVPSGTDLAKFANPVPWIGGSGRLGRAILAITTRNAIDWVTGDRLSTELIRSLRSEGELDNHHVFPRAVLKGEFEKNQIDNGLNGVILSKPANKALASKAPDAYLLKILEQSHGLTNDELRRRVESHFVPFDVLMSNKPIKSRYRQFISERAKLIAKEIAILVDLGN